MGCRGFAKVAWDFDEWGGRAENGCFSAGRTAQGTLGKGGVWVGRVRVLAGAGKRFSTESEFDESGWVARGVDAAERRGRRRVKREEDGDSSLCSYLGSLLGSSLLSSAFDGVRVAMCVRRLVTRAIG